MKRSVSVLAVIVFFIVGACASEPSRKNDVIVEKGAAGHREMTGKPVAPIEPISDGGAPTDGGQSPTLRPLPPPRSLPSSPLGPPKVDPIQITIFNRYLVKPKGQALPDGELKRLVEEATGAKVQTMRRTAVGYWLVQLEAATPPRTAEDQQKIIEQLQASGAFAVVERDQIMQIK
jgi:hypothetical protein